MKKFTPYSFIAKFVKFYDFYLSISGYKKLIEGFVEKLPVDRNTNLKVLDAGCGTGLYTMAVLKQYSNSEIISFDLNEKFIGQLSAKLKKEKLSHRARLFSADIQGDLLELNNQKFDLIMIAGVLEYVPIEKTVIRFSKSLISGGIFLHSPMRDNALGKFIGWLYGCKPYSQKINQEAFTNNGFTLKKVYIPKSFKELHIFQKD